MNSDMKEQVAFPEARAKKRNSRKAIWLIGLFGFMVITLLGGVLAGIIGYADERSGRDFKDGIAPWFFAIFILGFAILGVQWSWKYWQSIDEMARRAHLDSWFWGGSIAAIPVAGFATILFSFPEVEFHLIDRLAATPSAAFGLGALVMYAALLLGYTIFWLIWWAKKR